MRLVGIRPPARPAISMANASEWPVPRRKGGGGGGGGASAVSASGRSGLPVIATVNAPDDLATWSISIVSFVLPLLEMAMATERSDRIAALASPWCTSPQAWALTPMR